MVLLVAALPTVLCAAMVAFFSLCPNTMSQNSGCIFRYFLAQWSFTSHMSNGGGPLSGKAMIGSIRLVTRVMIQIIHSKPFILICQMVVSVYKSIIFCPFWYYINIYKAMLVLPSHRSSCQRNAIFLRSSNFLVD